MRSTIARSLNQYIGIVLGALIFAIAFSWFLIPYKIAPGGIGGLAQIFYHLWGFPVGVTIIILNIPLFIVSFILMGSRFGVRSIFGMFATSILIDVVNLKNLYNWGIISNLEAISHQVGSKTIYAMLAPKDIYLSAIAGSVLLGIGLGLIFRFRGSTGGTDIPVAVIKQKTGLSIGTSYWLIETIIIFAVGIIFKDLKLIIWGYINLFISTKLTDIASEGLPYVKGAYIISEFTDDIRAEIYKHINRGVTYIKAEGGYTGAKFDILFCVMNRRQIAILRDLVKDIDPGAFVILTDVNDVMGYGFKSRNLDLKNIE